MGCGASKPEATRSGDDGRRLLAGEEDMPHPQAGSRMMQKMPAAPLEKAKHPHHHPSKAAPHKHAAPPRQGPPPPRGPPKTQPPQRPQQFVGQSTRGMGPAPPKPGQAPRAPQQPHQKRPNKPVNTGMNRMDAIEESKTVETKDIKFRYAYLSQRGRYPDDPHKANQDAYCIHDHIVHKPSVNRQASSPDHFFAVFDGHGATGDGCAQYAKRELPRQLDRALHKARAEMSKHTTTESNSHELSKDQIQHALLRAHDETNKALHKDASIDDSLSGTTAISCYFHGRRNRLTISNVGDSRAVLGRKDTPKEGAPMRGGGGLKALPLSRDQTPYRKDERKRVKACGARVLSLDQLEGLEPIDPDHSETENGEDELVLGEELDEDGDPPRIWAQDGEYPGTAFSRSIGDAMAEDLGVFAEPEMLSREITKEDRILVLASDGVFEFLTNQSVIDICAKFGDPLEACRAVVAEAYELWLQYELRTDDITIICMFIDEVKTTHDFRSSLTSAAKQGSSRAGIPGKMVAEIKAATASSSFDEDSVDNVALTSEGLKPVRKKVSKEKSKEIEKLKQLGKTMHQQPEDDGFDWKKLATEKTEEEKKGIAEAIKASVMFRNVNDEQREMIYSCMESVKVKKGTWVIRQGTVGDRYYIIDEGQFEVRILPDGTEDVTGEGGNTVHVYEGSRQMNSHPAFGELALMYSAPRSASIVAQSDGHLWALHRSAFRQILVQAQDDRQPLKKALGEIPYFQYMDSDGINKLAAIMDETTFGRGENITHQGQPGKALYIIQRGSCYTTQMTPTKTERGTIKAGACFGDEIFSGSGAYGMSVMALQTTTCWQLDADLMKKTMGPLLNGDVSG
jgi:serine/threonine protein phosphatase PrpC/CRP-like cAMP-binding protein